jgi:L-malate glycosyltransferase
MKPRVLQLICSFHQGGSERQAIQLTRLLLESDRYDIDVAVLDGTGVLRGDIEKLGFPEILEYPLSSFYDANYIKQLRRFSRMLIERQISILQTSDFYTNIFGLMGAALARVPVRIGARRETTGWRNRKQKFAERCSYRFADNVVANAEACRALLVKEGVPDRKIVTIYNGLDTSRVTAPPGINRETAREALGLPGNGARYVTMIANLRSSVKNYPMFLRAAKIVGREIPEARFIIAGEGKLLDPTRSLAAEMGLADSVLFLGRCLRVAELLAATEVCAFSSSHEGFSNSILEYMAAGRPVVVTNVGGASEAVIENETGHIVDADDHQKMAERIIGLLRAPERARRMGERGREIVAQKFSVEAQLKQTLDLYESLLRKRIQQYPARINGAHLRSR